jgi:zinc finger FYVE domain-containing protein 1
VSIFGNTGDGKSHTLNHTFFNGRPIFRTSQKQETCTMGVWCAYDPITNSLIFDTEGLLGTTQNENKRMRLLLKVLAISDVIVYRTRAERLHNDLFKFLSDASVAYLKYFSKELRAAALKLKLDTISSLGPDCVLFHETQHTDVLADEFDADGHQRTVAHHLRDRFAKLDLSYNAFSSIEYVGTRTRTTAAATAAASAVYSTDFGKLAHTVRTLLRNNSVRPPRKLSSIYQVFKVLNDKFNGVITKNQISTFADEYFTCSALCLSCGYTFNSILLLSSIRKSTFFWILDWMDVIEHPTKSNSENLKKLDFQHTFNVKNSLMLDFQSKFSWFERVFYIFAVFVSNGSR